VRFLQDICMSKAAMWVGCAHTCVVRLQVKEGKGRLPFSASELSYHRECNLPQELADGGTCGLSVLSYIHCFLRDLPKGLKLLRCPQGIA
jgi:hypothetical protein